MKTIPARSTTILTIKLFWYFTKQHKLFFWLGTIGAAVGVILQDILPPIVVAMAFDRLQEAAQTGSPVVLEDFLPYVFGYLSFVVIGVVVWRLQVMAVWKYEIQTQRNLAVHIFDHLQKMGRKFHANRFGGALVSAANKLVSAYEKVMDEFTWSITTGIVAFISSIIVLAFVAPFYAVIFIVVSAIYFRVMYVRTKKTMKYDRAVSTSESDRTAKLADMIANVSAVNAFAGERHETKLFEQQADQTVDHYNRLFKQSMINDVLSHSMTGSISIIAFTSGVLAITVFSQPAGVLFLAVNYTLQMTNRLWQATRVMRNLNRALGDAADMTEVLQLKPEIKDFKNAKDLKVTRGDIRFESVNFTYDKHDQNQLFEDIDLHIKPGEKVGLVGRSGGGKTTITMLLLRFMDIQSGQILVDNQDISKVTQESLRQNIAFVPQEPILFHRSLADNIAYGRNDASLREIRHFAKLAHADEFITKLPDGYDTLVGERGVKLSGGQRQRIAIARAMLKNAPILILDEATSALDSESELIIQDALWSLIENRTAIIVAHRLSTIQKMDRILVMDNGRILEQGSHKELIRQGGVYANLWNHQSGGFLKEQK